MIVKYETYSYNLSNEHERTAYNLLCMKMIDFGHTRRICTLEEDPLGAEEVWPMGDHYLNERGKKCWPWVEFKSTSGRKLHGYILTGAPLLPDIVRAEPEKSASRLAVEAVLSGAVTTHKEAALLFGLRRSTVTQALINFKSESDRPRRTIPNRPRRSAKPKRPAVKDGRAKKAAIWFLNNPPANRADAAAKFGITVGAVSAALHRYVNPDLIPFGRPGLAERPTVRELDEDDRAKAAAKWIYKALVREVPVSIREAAARYYVEPDQVRSMYAALYPWMPTPPDRI